jgi:hypothetical protein
MIEISPETMCKGQITSISITNNGTTEILEISPIPFELFNNENMKKVISKYYLKKQVCMNLVQQLAMAESEFSEAKKDFDSLVHLPVINDKAMVVKPEIHEQLPIIEPGIEEAHKNFVKEHQLTQPLSEHILQQAPEPHIEPYNEKIKLLSEPEIKKVETIEEISTSIMNLAEFQALLDNNNLKNASMNAIISKNVKPEMVDTIRDVIITKLKEKGNIELSLSEKALNTVKNVLRKTPGRKKVELSMKIDGAFPE